MRRQDIRLGVPYASQERKRMPVRPVVILATTPYMHRRRGETGSAFMPAAGRVGQAYGPAVGYPVVQAVSGRRSTEPDWNQVASRMARYTLADFTAAQDPAIDGDITFGLADRLACVLGPWDEVIAAIAAKRARVDRMAAEADERERASRIRAGAVIASLAAAGVAVKPPYLTGEVTVIGIALGEAEKLAVLLGASTEGTGG